MLRSQILFPILAAALLAGSPRTAEAQEPAQQAQQADTAQAAQESIAIPAAEIVVRAEEANTQLRELRAEATAQPQVEEIAEQLPEFLARRDSLMADAASQEQVGLSQRALESAHRRWERYMGQLDSWQRALTERSQTLGAEQEAVQPARELWEATAGAAGEQGYPEAAVQVIASVLAGIDSLDAQIRSRLDVVLTLQNQVADLTGEATEVLARIDAAEAEARQGLLTPQTPPLWKAIGSGEVGDSWPQVKTSVQDDLSTLAQFFVDEQEPFAIQGVLFLLLLVVMIELRRRSKRWVEEDPELEASARIFDRPFSATLLIFIITNRLFHPQMPRAAADLNGTLLLIPILRLLPGLMHPALRRPLYAFAALWLINDQLPLLPEASVLQRLVLLLVTSLALAGFVWFLKTLEQEAEALGKAARVALGVGRLAVLTLAGSFIANILGFVDLAFLLTYGTLASILVAAGLYAAVQVLEGLLRLSFRTQTAQSIGSVRRHSNLLIRRSLRVIKLAALVFGAAVIFNLFGLLGPVTGIGSAVLFAPLSVGSLSISLGDILVFVLAIWVATLASRFTRFVLEQDVFPNLALPRGVPGAITKVSQYVIIGLGLMIAFAAAGIDLSNLTLLAGALGVGIGFGLQAIVNNFVSGLIVIFERPIQVGDTIALDTLVGTVKHIGIRASTVRTFDGAEVLVPNGDLISGRVVNWTLSDRLRRIEVTVGVAYGTNPHQVQDILLQVARDHPDTLENPKPYVLFNGFGDHSLDFQLRLWTSNFENWIFVQSDVVFAVHDALIAAGIEIPFPQQDLHVKSIAGSISGREVAKALGDRDGDEPAPLAEPEASAEPSGVMPHQRAES